MGNKPDPDDFIKDSELYRTRIEIAFEFSENPGSASETHGSQVYELLEIFSDQQGVSIEATTENLETGEVVARSDIDWSSTGDS